ADACWWASPAVPPLPEACTTALRRRVAQRVAQDDGARQPLVGHLCERYLDAPALWVQPAPWGGEMDVCAACQHERRRPRATRIATPGERLRCLRAQHGTGCCDVSHRERLDRRPRPERGVLVFKGWSCLRGGEDDSEAFALQNVIFRSLHFCNTALFPVVRQDAERPGRLQRRARLGGLLTDDACDTAGVF